MAFDIIKSTARRTGITFSDSFVFEFEGDKVCEIESVSLSAEITEGHVGEDAPCNGLYVSCHISSRKLKSNGTPDENGSSLLVTLVTTARLVLLSALRLLKLLASAKTWLITFRLSRFGSSSAIDVTFSRWELRTSRMNAARLSRLALRNSRIDSSGWSQCVAGSSQQNSSVGSQPMKASSLPFGLSPFVIRFTGDASVSIADRVVKAKNARQAWAKFCRQYFGALKPARSDYRITKA